MERLKRYKKQMVALMSALVILVGGIFSTSFQTNASISGEYYVPYSEPTANDTCGYFNVDSGGILYTYFWNITGTWVDTGNIPTAEMYITISGNDVVFHPYVYHGSGTSYLTLGYYDFTGQINFIYYGGIGINNYERVETFYGGIQGVSFGGNCSFGSSGLSLGTPLIHWNYSADGLMLSNMLNRIYSELSTFGSQMYEIYFELQRVYNQCVFIEDRIGYVQSTLNAIYAKAEELLEEEKEQTSWLGRIWESMQNFFQPDDTDKETTDVLKENSDNQSERINDLNEKGKTEKVDVDSASGSVDAYIDGNAIQNYGVLLSVFTNHEYILKSILVVLAIGLVAYVLFGKKR